jgi:excisionase family DNA binding protein
MVDSELRTLNSELKSQGEIKMDKYSELRTTNYELRTKEIMTPREAAEYLSIHVRTIYRLAKNGDIPGRKVGGSWRFKKDALDEWLSWKENPSSNEKG